MIRINNIYHMLAYAFQLLKSDGYINCETEAFENTAELLSAILVQGVTVQIKRGLGRAYTETTESIGGVRGKINVSASIKQGTIHKKQLICTYDEFTEDTYLNRIIKTTIELLVKCEISTNRKTELRKLLCYFKEVSSIDYHRIEWNIRYNRNNQSYRMLISVCYLVIKGLLQTNKAGNLKMMNFLDEQRMCRLYEKFILEYYRKEHPYIRAAASQIAWALDDGLGPMLPIMQSDIMLSYGEKTLIIDAKYYAHTTQTQFEKHTLHSNNLYQIFTYVKNKAAQGGEVSGMLLYARTDEDVQPNNMYKMSGNLITVRTLNLDEPFENIRAQLDEIAAQFVGIGTAVP